MTPTRDEVVALLENMAAANEEWAVKNGTGPAKAGAKRDAGIYRLALALLEQGRRDGERLDWLEKQNGNEVTMWCDSSGSHCTVATGKYSGQTWTGFTLRDAIDAARGMTPNA